MYLLRCLNAEMLMPSLAHSVEKSLMIEYERLAFSSSLRGSRVKSMPLARWRLSVLLRVVAKELRSAPGGNFSNGFMFFFLFVLVIVFFPLPFTGGAACFFSPEE